MVLSRDRHRFYCIIPPFRIKPACGMRPLIRFASEHGGLLCAHAGHYPNEEIVSQNLLLERPESWLLSNGPPICTQNPLNHIFSLIVSSLSTL